VVERVGKDRHNACAVDGRDDSGRKGLSGSTRGAGDDDRVAVVGREEARGATVDGDGGRGERGTEDDRVREGNEGG
jgi:hypothetical protein